jgi:hypothetical protein
MESVPLDSVLQSIFPLPAQKAVTNKPSSIQPAFSKQKVRRLANPGVLP